MYAFIKNLFIPMPVEIEVEKAATIRALMSAR